jgi:hypothetical protein
MQYSKLTGQTVKRSYFADDIMADDANAVVDLKKKRTFRKFTYRGVDLDQLLDVNNEQLMELYTCRIRRKFSRGLKVYEISIQCFEVLDVLL